MIYSGIMINAGPLEKISATEKKHIKDHIPMLNMCGVPIEGPYYRKINDDITIVFSDSRFERFFRGDDWGVFYFLEPVYKKDSATDSQDTDSLIPLIFGLKPDISIFQYRWFLEEPKTTFTAIYKKSHYFQSLPLKSGAGTGLPDNGIITMKLIV